MLTDRKITVFFDLPAAHDELLRDRPAVAKKNLYKVLARSEVANIHLFQIGDNASIRIDKLAIVVVNNNLLYALALDVEDAVGRIREDINAGKVVVVNADGDGQVQGHHRVATIRCMQCLSIVTCFTITYRIPFITGISSGDGEIRGGRVIDGQAQRHRTVTTRSIRECTRVVAGNGKCFIVPDVLIANRFREFCRIYRVNDQRQRNETVTTVNRLQSIHINTGFCERIAEEVVTITLTHCMGYRCVIDRIHSQGQRNHTVTSVDSLQRVGVCSRSNKRLPKEIETLALAHHVCNRRVIDGIHRQRQRNYTVATINRLQSIYINA